jgi:hypothetical protein
MLIKGAKKKRIDETATESQALPPPFYLFISNYMCLVFFIIIDINALMTLKKVYVSIMQCTKKVIHFSFLLLLVFFFPQKLYIRYLEKLLIHPCFLYNGMCLSSLIEKTILGK